MSKYEDMDNGLQFRARISEVDTAIVRLREWICDMVPGEKDSDALWADLGDVMDRFHFVVDQLHGKEWLK